MCISFLKVVSVLTSRQDLRWRQMDNNISWSIIYVCGVQFCSHCTSNAHERDE